MTEWYRKSIGEVLKELNSSLNGLSSEEAKERLKRYGRNVLEKRKKIKPIIIFLNQFKSFLIFILIIAAVVAGFMGHAGSNKGDYIDMFVILAIVILNAILGFFQEYKAERSLEALKKLSAPNAFVIRNGRKEIISPDELVPGDVTLLKTGDKVPADARIIEQIHLHIDESVLTGESVPVAKFSERIKKEVPINDQKNMLFMNTIVTRGRAKAIVVETGKNTEVGKIAHLIKTAEERETPLQKKLAQLGKSIGIAILAIVVVVFALGVVRDPSNIKEIFLVAVSLAVAAVPEGLPAVVTISLAIGVTRMVRSNAVIRKLPAVETLGATDFICSDKTGTLTKNEMTIKKIYTNQKTIDVTGIGYNPKGEFKINGKTLSQVDRRHVELCGKIGALCNNADIVKTEEGWSVFGDPTEASFKVLAMKAGINIKNLAETCPRIEEIEFTSERKMMSTVHREGSEILIYTKGAPEVVLNMCSHIYIDEKVKKLTKTDKRKILDETGRMASDALRVLALAFKKSKTIPKEKEIEKNLIFVGIVGMIDPPRKEIINAVKVCKEAGITPVMITGDHKITAEAIAKQIGILEEGGLVLTGEELSKMTESKLMSIVERIRVYARVSSNDKVKILKALQKKGHVVAMTGDGINDAPALKNADIGIAMGIKGTDVAKEASDMVLRDDNFATIVKAVKEGRGIYDNIKKFVNYLLTSNAGEILIIFVASLIGLPLPLLAVQILWINLLTDGLPAVALSVDPYSKGIMKRKPRSPKEKIIDMDMIIDIILVGMLMCIGTLYLFNLALRSGVTIRYAQTIALSSVVMLEIVRIQMVREKHKVGVLSNRYLILAIVSSIALLLSIVYLPHFQKLFKTVAIGVSDWIKIVVMVSIIFLIFQVKIIIWRHMRDESNR